MKSRFGLKIRKHHRLAMLNLKNSPVYVKTGDVLVVETNRGEEIGAAIKVPHGCERTNHHAEITIHHIERIATTEDLKKLEELPKEEHKYLLAANKYLQEQKLDLKNITCELPFNKKKLILFYKIIYEEQKNKKDKYKQKKINKPNFKTLGKDLYNLFKLPVELRETGNRGEAKVLGGLGHCGCKLCCSSWLHKARHVSIKMAKEQSLAINIPKITGLCDKLMCCIEYEHNQYHNGKIPDLVKKEKVDEENLLEYAKMFKEKDD